MQTQNVVFNDANVGDVISYDDLTDSTYDDGYAGDAPLGDFLSRPVKIRSYVWQEGSSLSETFEPWYDFLHQNQIRSKIENFGLMQAKLHLKVMISCSPFYYGLGRLSYNPLPSYTESTISTIPLVPRSQRPGFWFDAGSSEGGEIELPFFYPDTWLDITSEAAVQGMGEVHLDSVGSLRNANGIVTGDVTISVFAWMTSVKLNVPTTAYSLQSQNVSLHICRRCKRQMYQCACLFECEFGPSRGKVKLLLQAIRKSVKKVLKLQAGSGKVSRSGAKGSRMKKKVVTASGPSDEYGKGVVSSVASAVASATGMLSSVPVIGPYMTTTSVVAEGLADVASAFGYSNAPMLDNVPARVTLPFPSMASPEISTPVAKLTLDPKNELCVDSRTVGLDGTDEMTIESIVTRESYVDAFGWDDTEASGTLLFKTRINPHFFRATAVVAPESRGTSLDMVPMDHMARAFRDWRGDVIIKFKVIATKYHQGRLEIFWDPRVDASGYANPETATFYRTIDIAKDREIEIRVPYMAARPWLETQQRIKNQIYSTSVTTLGPFEHMDNGILSVRVLNNLSGPSAAADVTVAVLVRGAENMEFANPAEVDARFTQFALQSGEASVADAKALPIQEMGDPKDCVDHISLISMGESIKSIRTLMRRTAHSRSIAINADGDNRDYLTEYRIVKTPAYPGYNTYGLDKTVGGHDFNYARNTATTWFTPCYVGQRGSMNWHVNCTGPSIPTSLSVTRSDQTMTDTSATTMRYIDYTASSSSVAWSSLESESTVSSGGGALTNGTYQPALSYQHPFYNERRFANTRPIFQLRGWAVDHTDDDAVVVSARVAGNAANPRANVMHFYQSIGIDFSLFFYRNVPHFILMDSIPLP